MTTINLQPTLNLSLDLLERFISDSDFLTRIGLAFGEEKAANISPNSLRLALNTLPVIDVRTSEELKGALGAFSAQTGKIYLSESILSDEALTTQVLWEEIGHYLDSYFGGGDAPGDEGEIWRNLVLNQTLTEAELNALKSENDHDTIILDGQEIAIEMAFGTTGYIQFGTSSGDGANGISTDSSGNVYVTGKTTGSFPGNSYLGFYDTFVAKYDASGTQVWVKQFGTSGEDYANGISIDSSGNVYVTGYTNGGLPGNSRLGVYDTFVAKYDASGTQVWVKQFGTSSEDYANGISTDSSGNVYVTGYTTGSLPGNSNFGSGDAFVAKYDASGTQLWVKQFGSSDSDQANGISTYSSGNIYVTGNTSGSLPGNSNFGSGDVFVAKYDASGTQLWVKQFGSSSYDSATGISTDSSGNIYVTGNTSGSLPGNSNLGSGDVFVAKYDASGTQLWVKQFGTSSSDGATGISTDSSGNVYVTGNTSGIFPSNSYLGGISDAFVAKYDASGTQVWVKQFGTSNLDDAQGISTDSSGNVYVTGETFGSLPGNSNLGGIIDAFVVGFDANGNLLNTPNPYTSLESNGNTKLVKDSQGKLYARAGTNTPIAITNSGTQLSENIYLGWQTLSVESVNGINKVLWKNAGSNLLSVWVMNNNWQLTSVEGHYPTNSPQALALESQFQMDLNGDNFIGIENAGYIQFGTSNEDIAKGISTDSSGNVYVTGKTYGSLPGNSNSGSLDVFVAKYDASGTQLWVKQFGTFSFDEVQGISTDLSGNVYVTGETYGSLPGNSNLGYTDAFVAKYDASGTQVWVKQFGTSSTDSAEGISTDLSGNVYVTGYTYSSLPGNSDLGSPDAFVAKYDATGTQVWVKQFGTSSFDRAQGISTDSSGNVYVTGKIGGSLPGNSNLGFFGNDAFVAKYDAIGTQLWVKQFGTTSIFDSANGISTDSSGNVYVTGETDGSLPGYSNLGIFDAFVAKYDASGTQLWVKQFGTSRFDGAQGISTDSSGNVYITGSTQGSLPGNSNLGSSDAFVAKYDASGTQLWVKQFGTSSFDEAEGISTDSSGNVYVTGKTGGSLPGNNNLGSSDAFVVGFDANGNLLNTFNPLPTDPLTSPVYRFYNAQSKGHFFTTNAQERETVLANPQWGYTYEDGFGFKASTNPGQNLLEVFRFYNAQSRGHFFTTNVQERDTVLANPQWGYTYEAGLGFYAYGIDANLGSDVYRFYNAQSKGHFFTLDPSERDTVLANPQWGYTYEAGLGFEASP